jgi:uncharacterized protein YaeQ
METTRKVRIEAIVIYDDDKMLFTLGMANLLEEFANWMKDVGPLSIEEKGDIGLPSGTIKWRAVE